MLRNKSMISSINSLIKCGFSSKASRRSESSRATKHLKLSYYSITPLIAYSGEKVLNPIVLYHGLMTTKDIWQPIIAPLAELTKRPVFAVDARNHGESPFCRHHSLASLTKDLHSFFEEMYIDKAILIGQGCGAKSALQLSTLRPDKVEKLVAIDLSSPSIPGIDTSVMKKVFDILIHSTIKFERNEKLDTCRDRLYVNLAQILNHEPLIHYFVSKLVMNEHKELRLKFNISTLKKFLLNPDETHFRFKFPFKGYTLLMHRRPFRAVRQDYSVLRKNLPNSRYVFIKARHFMQIHEPKRFVKSVANFINEASET